VTVNRGLDEEVGEPQYTRSERGKRWLVDAALVPPDWALREIAHLPQWQRGALAPAGAIAEA
jgi:hypothetical protein